jgi:hypothetical protein
MICVWGCGSNFFFDQIQAMLFAFFSQRQRLFFFFFLFFFHTFSHFFFCLDCFPEERETVDRTRADEDGF